MLGRRLAALVCVASLLVGCGGGGSRDDEPLPTAERLGGRDGLPVACVQRSKYGGCPTRSGLWFYDYRDNRCKLAGPDDCGYSFFASKGKCDSYCGARP